MEKSHLLIFFRFVMGYVFVFSLAGKLRNIPSFVQTITNFRFFPSKFSQPLAYIILIGEVSVVVAMLIGKNLLLWGFLITSLMFLAFSIALSSVIDRNIKTSCNCFGPDEKDVGASHVIRSLSFMVCGIGGQIVSYHPFPLVQPDFIMIVTMGFVSIAFVVVWMNISDIIKIFRIVQR